MITIETNEKHAKFSPSAAHRWVICPASLLYEGSGETSIYADEGTVAHWLLAKAIGGEDIEKYVGETVRAKEHKIKVTDEMVATVLEAYVALTQEKLYKQAKGKAKTEVLLESKKHKDFFGTCDILIETPNTVGIYDYKHGKGVKVEVEGNLQLLVYALLYIASTGKKPKKFRLGILQPRMKNIYFEDVKTSDVIEWGKTHVLPVLNGKNLDKYFPDEKACKWCPGRGSCEANMRYVFEQAGEEFQKYLDKDADQLSDEEIGRLLDSRDLILDFYRRLETKAMERMNADGNIPGWKLVEGRSFRKWKDEKEAESFLVDILGDDAYEKKLKSPAKAEKGIDKKYLKRLNSLIEKPKGKPTLAPITDKRPAINAAANDFADYLE